MQQQTANRQSSIGNRRSAVAWQGWRLELPARWSPVKLEGDYDAGYALFADLHRPRLGLRWRRAGRRKFDAGKWAQKTLREEVGKLAAEEAKGFGMQNPEAWEGSTLYIEPEPPGRDVWVGVSKSSGRVLEVIHHAHRRERILPDAILPTLEDLPADRAMPWAIFELSCVVPAGMKLLAQQLNAGDLSLMFGRGKSEFVVRQVAVAQLALQRLPIEKWLAQQQSMRRKHYRPVGEIREIALTSESGRELSGVARELRRRRRFGWNWRLPQAMTTYALHDETRDRLVMLQGTDEGILKELAASVGWAQS